MSFKTMKKLFHRKANRFTSASLPHPISIFFLFYTSIKSRPL